MTNSATEKLVRTAIVALAQTVPQIGKVFDRRRVINSKADYLTLLGVRETGASKYEIRACFVEFKSFNDTEDGCDDCPIFECLYTLRVVHEFADARANGSNSSDDFAAVVMDLRDKFLTRAALDLGESVENEKLITVTPATFDFDPLTGVDGAHIIEFSLTVRVAPDCE